ncbi:DUF6547 family protein [Paenibacillus harenae]|uniref:DUF6547 family protein n=1 Tax=Paenibacillus harenae TaxID=306543 RepID=UPI0027912B86|nr:DUF6547 family protein [Paenibacillus harenae]MDQ0058656.1 ABC-type antimicrobial peptide transport system ATPase subunit [Paenibacillus harenae]
MDKTANEKYKSMIDDLVTLRYASHHRWILEQCWPESSEFENINEVLNGFTLEQKQTIALIAQNARDSGIHDVLLYLSNKIIAGSLEISMDGIQLLPELFEDGMHSDWEYRHEGE